MDNLIIFIYFYLLIGIIILFCKIKIFPKIYTIYITLILFFILKWTLNYRKCTITYIEYKLRNSKKENCILYRLIDNIMDLRYNKNIIGFYFLSLILLFDYFIIKTNK